VDEIQPVVNELLATNLIMRKGHGTYVITDPFVQEIWLERKELRGSRLLMLADALRRALTPLKASR